MRTIQELQGQPVALRLLNAYLTKKLPDLIVLHGPDGTGKWSAAEAFIQQQLCTSNNSCGTCVACQKVLSKNHSDIIQFPDDRVLIGNTDNPEMFSIRWLLQKKIRYAPFDADIRFVIFPRADLIQHEAETALLKTLEEGSGHTHFIFITNDLHKLKHTIISRAILIPFKSLSHESLKKLTQIPLNQQELDTLGGSLHYLPLLKSELQNILKEKIEESLRHPLSLLELEKWFLSSKPEITEILQESQYNEMDFVDYFGLQLIILTRDHPNHNQIAQAVLEFKKGTNRMMPGLLPYLSGKLFSLLNECFYSNK